MEKHWFPGDNSQPGLPDYIRPYHLTNVIRKVIIIIIIIVVIIIGAANVAVVAAAAAVVVSVIVWRWYFL